MSWRKFRVLVDGLPQDSRTVTAQIDVARDLDLPKPDGPEPTQRWGQDNHQLQSLRDDIRLLHHTVISALGGKPGKFAPLPRPTDRRYEAQLKVREEQFRRMQARVKIAPSLPVSEG